MTRAIAAKRHLEKLLRTRGWNRGLGTWRNRVYDLVSCRYPWWDWGHRLMILTGTDFGGNWDEPKPPTWWYVETTPKRMWHTRYPRTRYEVVTNYAEMRRRTQHLDEDGMYHWRAICVNQDGNLHLGRQYWGGTFHGLDYAETQIVLRYLARWQLTNWFGARGWLYRQGLHAAVHRKKPGSCAAVPPKDAGGYSHWRCEIKRGHPGLHRYGNTVWGEVGGEQIGCTHVGDDELV